MVDSEGDGSYGYVDRNGHFVLPPENLADRPEDAEVEMQLAVARKIKAVGDGDSPTPPKPGRTMRQQCRGCLTGGGNKVL